MGTPDTFEIINFNPSSPSCFNCYAYIHNSITYMAAGINMLKKFTKLQEKEKSRLLGLAFPPVVCKLLLTRHKPSTKMKGENNNENRKNQSETEGRSSDLTYGKRRGSKTV